MFVVLGNVPRVVMLGAAAGFLLSFPLTMSWAALGAAIGWGVAYMYLQALETTVNNLADIGIDVTENEDGE